ncbi:MAG TPA: SDR family oxidoreductase [Vicinamibacteria bacterium]
MNGRVLVTGGDGYLGRRVARALLEEGRAVRLWVHARDAAALEVRRQAAAAELGGFGRLLAWSGGDLRAAEPFAGVDPGELEAIVHAAAVVRFNVDAASADRVNVAGTARLAAFARRCPRLRFCGLLSTVYASGLAEGVVEEALLPRPAFANHYERSKWEAEQLLAREEALPWRILRVATAIADDDGGGVSHHNAVHHTLQLLYYGLVSTLPGRPETPLYLVTADFVARAVRRLLENSEPHQVYHLAHRREQSLTLGGLLELAWEAFAAEPSFRRRRLLRPLFLDEPGFALLSGALTTFSGSVVGDAVASLSPFAAQLFRDKQVANARLLGALGHDPAPDAAALARATLAHLVRTRWGRPHAA